MVDYKNFYKFTGDETLENSEQMEDMVETLNVAGVRVIWEKHRTTPG